MTKKPPFEPSRREVLSGLAILIVLGGVAVSRSGSPQTSWASQNAAQVETAGPLAQKSQHGQEAVNAKPETVASLKGELAAGDQTLREE